MNRSWRMTGEMPRQRDERGTGKKRDGVGEGDGGDKREPRGGRPGRAPARGCGSLRGIAQVVTQRSLCESSENRWSSAARPLPHSAACSRRTARRPPRVS